MNKLTYLKFYLDLNFVSLKQQFFMVLKSMALYEILKH